MSPVKFVKLWVKVLHAERRTLGLPEIRHMAWLTLRPWRWRIGKQYHRRLDHCKACIVYNPILMQCRGKDGDKTYGCGCFLPMLIRFGGSCWLTDTKQRGGWR